MAYLTIVAPPLFCMTLLTGIHFHCGNAITRQTVFPEGRKFLLLGNIPVTLNTLNILRLVGGMGKVDVVRLPGVYLPGDFTILLYILLDEDPLILGLSHLRLMTFLAFVKLRNACIGAVFSERVAIFTSRVLVSGVTEVDGLDFLGIEQVGEYPPTED